MTRFVEFKSLPHPNLQCSCRPTGRVSALRTHTVSVRIRVGVPNMMYLCPRGLGAGLQTRSGWFNSNNILQTMRVRTRCTASLPSFAERVRFPLSAPICFVRLMAGPLLYTQQTEVRFFHEAPNMHSKLTR